MRFPHIFMLLTLFTIACSKGDNDEPQPDNKQPEKASLVFPLNNSECISGTDPAGSMIVEFRWTGSGNDAYELVLENLMSFETSRFTTTENKVEVPLLRNNPYQWYVISRVTGSEGTEVSESWKFYTSGDAVSNYAPFPATLISPAEGHDFEKGSTEITLEWESSDIDDTELLYDLYAAIDYGQEERIANDLEEPAFVLTVEDGANIRWRVVSKDKAGNSSTSRTAGFNVLGGTPILSFTITGNDSVYRAIIDEDLKQIRIRLGNFDYKKLVPEIELKEGYTINPPEGQAMNFHDDLFFLITGPEGAEIRYDLLVESGQHQVRSFKVFNGTETYIAEIDNEAATIYIELGNLDYSSISAEVELSPDASVDPLELSGLDLTSSASFTVYSEIGTSREYTVVAPIGMERIFSYFRNPGFYFSDPPVEPVYTVFAGSTHYIQAFNIQDRAQVSVHMVNADGNKFPLSLSRDAIHHQHSFEKSTTLNFLTATLADDLPSGTYTMEISEGSRIKAYPHPVEVINDERTVRITGVNKTNIGLGDTLIMRGQNLRKNFAIKKDASIYVFSEYVDELSINEDNTEMQLIFSYNIWSSLRSWSEPQERPLAIQTVIDGYPTSINSNIVYLFVN